MKRLRLIPILLIMGISANAQLKECSGSCCKKETAFKCKLTTAEFREGKATVIAELKGMVKKKKELKDGYSFKFSGTDDVVAKLNEFIKTEKECCDFLSFSLVVAKDKSSVWLEITGAEGVKSFIKTEIEM